MARKKCLQCPVYGQFETSSLSELYCILALEIILGDPGAVSGGGKKSKRARKNSGEETSRTSERKLVNCAAKKSRGLGIVTKQDRVNSIY